MNDQEIKAKIKSTGNDAFIQYFEQFESYADANDEKTKAEYYEYIEKHKGGASWRCPSAEAIFRANAQCRALEIIAGKSPRYLPKWVIKQANVLLQKCPNR